MEDWEERTEKPILLSGSDPEMMTFTEVYKQFQRMLRKKAYSWSGSYEYDELLQVAGIALWKAYDRYDCANKPIPFAAVAATYIKYSLLAHHQKYKSKHNRKTSQIRSLCSLHDLVYDKNGEGTELQDLIGEEETFTQETTDRVILDKLLNRIPKQQRDDLFAYVDGYKMRELAEAKDLSSQTIAKRIRHSFLRFRALYIKELSR
ncbi:sigma-70 family RNA polymerase sigma factor [Paenibacillus zanthoxyli]|uniref:sigma-70 family RNA polymerase sigma factor n=1 Tax=Paenibacillus zanthoxyli TaxID=369399 RepID=UPI0004713536|nr:sigma-70 family RNA polymerase sigma factor [Paenibacillus zanthoxyli]